MRNISILFFSFLLFSCKHKTPYKAFDRNENIYVRYTNGKVKQLTDTGMDTTPVLSPDKKYVVFIRKTDNPDMESGSGDGVNNEIWLYDLDAGKCKRIVRCKEGDSPETILVNLQGFYFTSDSRRIYFMSDAWATSASIHRYDISTGKEKFISDGNDLFVIPEGKYKDDLILNKHKYYDSEDGGSYDPYCLVNPEGKELKEIGEKESDVAKFLKANK